MPPVVLWLRWLVTVPHCLCYSSCCFADDAYDLVLSSGFLAFAYHSGFLQAVQDAGIKVWAEAAARPARRNTCSWLLAQRLLKPQQSMRWHNCYCCAPGAGRDGHQQRRPVRGAVLGRLLAAGGGGTPPTFLQAHGLATFRRLGHGLPAAVPAVRQLQSKDNCKAKQIEGSRSRQFSRVCRQAELSRVPPIQLLRPSCRPWRGAMDLPGRGRAAGGGAAADLRGPGAPLRGDAPNPINLEY